LHLREKKLQEDGENFIVRNFIICTLHLILLGRSHEDEIGGYVARMGQMINIYKIWIGKHEQRRVFERRRRR
jgi:hypothetical protein